jgi:hypothetical protein
MNIRILSVSALLVFAMGCAMSWASAPFDIAVENAALDGYEINFNGEPEKKTLGPVDNHVYHILSKAEGVDQNYYNSGPQRPECTTVIATARNTGTGLYTNTVSLRVCQDVTAYIKILPSGQLIFIR